MAVLRAAAVAGCRGPGLAAGGAVSALTGARGHMHQVGQLLGELEGAADSLRRFFHGGVGVVHVTSLRSSAANIATIRENSVRICD